MTVDVTATSGSVTNVATIAVPVGATDPTPGNNSASDTDTIDPQADLAVTKTDGVVTVAAGGSTTYTVRVTNNGPSSVTGAILSDPAVAGLNKTAVVCSATPGQCVTAPTIAQLEGGAFALPALASGEFYEIAVTADVTATTGTVTNTATVTLPAGTADPTPGNNTASDTDGVGAALIIDPALAKAGNPTQASVGNAVTFTLTVTNAGNTPAPNVVITDPLPAMFDVSAVNVSGAPIGTSVNVTPPIGTGPAPYTVVVTLGGNLSVTSVVTVNIVTTVNGLGNPPINNSASVSTSAVDANPTNNADSVTITLRSAPSNPTSGFNRPALLPVTGFAPRVETELPAQPRDMMYTATDVMLEIPSLGVKIPIVGVPKKNGAWDVSWLGNQAGWLEGSAFPSWNGNSILTSHVYASNGLPGPFVNLSKLKYGDQVIVHAYGQKYIFAIQSNQVVSANDTSAFRHEEKPWLTLITCKEYDEKTNSYKSRVIVRAVLVNVLWDK